MKETAKNEGDSLNLALDCMKSGGVAVLPTDTVYGFSAAADLKKQPFLGTDERIRKIKGRGEDKPFIHLIAKPQDIFLYTDDPIPESLLAKWPGPLTIIVKLKEDSPLETKLKTVAFRCPGDQWLRKLIEETGRPLYSTSVNRSGFPVLDSADAIRSEFGGEIDLFVCDGDKKGAVPSTIVKVENGKIVVVRQGAVSI